MNRRNSGMQQTPIQLLQQAPPTMAVAGAASFPSSSFPSDFSGGVLVSADEVCRLTEEVARLRKALAEEATKAEGERMAAAEATKALKEMVMVCFMDEGTKM